MWVTSSKGSIYMGHGDGDGNEDGEGNGDGDGNGNWTATLMLGDENDLKWHKGVIWDCWWTKNRRQKLKWDVDFSLDNVHHVFSIWLHGLERELLEFCCHRASRFFREFFSPGRIHVYVIRTA